MASKKKISIFGVTGSIGQSTIDVILSAPDMFDVHTVTANNNAKKLAESAQKLNAKTAIICNSDKEDELTKLLENTNIKTLSGEHALINAAKEPIDLMIAAIMGFAGLEPITSALEQGTNIAVANKEPLVSAGQYITSLAKKTGAKILPVDSEHNAIFQVFENHNKENIDKLILTASGGPFLDWPIEKIKHATPEQAIAHPNWNMGAKISVDSATMMNKALEIIEAAYLFDMPADKIDVLIHPQSTIHSMVSYCDGSILCQMGASDMRTPIAYALSWPDRMVTPGQKLDLKNLSSLEFRQPDLQKFPAIGYAYKCLEQGQHACIAFNAANEIAVKNFLQNKISFGCIMTTVLYAIDHLIDKTEQFPLKTVADIKNFDTIIRQSVDSYIAQNFTKKDAS
ncbi:MAG: 1-deoxy-D-xylulose-5-phosphate reductoisomerase [Alphaproteobacteria bacterium]|nr:1-deoxy-D-xylulose-5-phosphate reductoisomerase [Alphaproteobacteria bacterium]